MKRLLIAALLLVCPVSVFAQRLPRTVIPVHYDLTFAPDFKTDTFDGSTAIDVTVQVPTREITLHALEMKFHEVTVEQGGRTQTAEVSLDPVSEMATLRIAQPLVGGGARIRMRYTGILNDKLRGFYLGRWSSGEKYASTQMESVDARRAFPSFDEPEWKATFDVTLVIDREHSGYSNGALLSDTPGPGEKHTLRFATTPRMSTYLVAMTVGRFACLEDQAEGIPLRICAAPDKIHLGRFAMDATKSFMTWFANYYSIDYPFQKLDQIGIADFQAGAMENTGSIIYRESLLLADEKTSSVTLRQFIAKIIAHEIAHQWFGDIVTMEWWNDIWLNEGFASWMATKPVHAWKPEWKADLSAIADVASTMSVDAKPTTHAIHATARTRGEIEELFDGISYGKGAAVLRMLESWLGEETFRRGVNLYLEKHAWANATSEDFIGALGEAAGKDLSPVLSTFIRLPGLPLVSAGFRCEGSETIVSLAQKRFYVDPALASRASNEVWSIPICFSRDGRSECHMFDTRETTMRLPGCSAVNVVNPNGTGYYVTSYTGGVGDLSRNVASLDEAARLVLIRDQWYLVRSGAATIPQYLELAAAYRGERNGEIVGELLTHLEVIAEEVAPGPAQARYQAWLRSFLAPLAQELGWTPAAGESDERRILRANVLYTLGYWARDPQVIRRSGELVKSYLSGRTELEGSLAENVLVIAASAGDSKLYEQLLKRLAAPRNPEEYRRVVRAIAFFPQPELARRTLDMTLTPAIKNQDVITVLERVVGHPPTQKLAWQWIKANWPALRAKVPEVSFGGLIGSTGAFCEEAAIADAQAFFAANPLQSAARAQKQAVEAMNLCVELRRREGAGLERWLQQAR